MLNWLGDKILSFHLPALTLEQFSASLFALFIPLMVFLLVSRRLNARAEAAASAPRRLPQLAQALSHLPEQSNVFFFLIKKMERPLAWLLRKLDWLMYDKLKLLPDVRTGRRLNFFIMLLVAWMAANSHRWAISSKTINLLMDMRNGGLLQDQTLSGAFGVVLKLFFMCLLYVFLLMLPFFIARKNRELYLDILALMVLIVLGSIKVVYCWADGCCFGVPFRWGVYSPDLGTTVFPVQLLECAFYVLGAFLCMLYILYAKSYRPGRGCSFCMIAFMVSRFYSETLRYHGEAYRLTDTGKIFGLNMVQIICLIGCILAFAWMILLPLEQKLMDRFRLFVVGRLRKLAGRKSSSI